MQHSNNNNNNDIYIYVCCVRPTWDMSVCPHEILYSSTFGALKGPSAPLQEKAGSSICQQEKHRIRCHETWGNPPRMEALMGKSSMNFERIFHQSVTTIVIVSI